MSESNGLSVPYVDMSLLRGQHAAVRDVLRVERFGLDLLLWQRQVDDTVQLLRVANFFAVGSDAQIEINVGQEQTQILTPASLVAVSPLALQTADIEPMSDPLSSAGDVVWLQLLASDMVQADGVWQQLLGSWAPSPSALSEVYVGVPALTPVLAPQWDSDPLGGRGVDALAPSLSLAPIEAMADGFIQHQEAVAGVWLHGQTEPNAWVHIQLQDAADTRTRKVQADDHGHWQVELATGDWWNAQGQPVFADGPVQISLYAQDGAGNRSATVQQQVDVRLTQPAAPSVQLSAESQTGRSGWSADATPSFEGQVPVGTELVWGEDLNGDGALQSSEQRSVALDAEGRFAWQAGQVGDGSHTWLAQSRDAWGSLSEVVQLPVMIDTVAPKISLDQQAKLQGARLLNQDVREGLNLTGTGEAGQSVQISLRAVDTGDSTNVTVYADDQGHWHAQLSLIQLNSLGNGDVALELSGADLAGNVATVANGGGLSLAMELQTVLPRLPTAVLQTTGSSETIVNDPTPTYMGIGPILGQVRWVPDFNADGLIDDEELRQASVAPVDASGHYGMTLAALGGDGTYNWNVQSIDRYGNVSDSALPKELTLDTQMPSMAQLDALTGDDNLSYQDVHQEGGILLSGQAEPGAQLSITLRQDGHQQGLSTTVAPDGRWAITVPSSVWQGFSDGQLEVQVNVRDVAGNDAPPLLRELPIRTSAVDPVNALSLEPGQDTGAYSTDGITMVDSPWLQISGAPNQWVRLVQDSGFNAVVDAQDKILGEVQLDGFGHARWQPESALAQGPIQILALGWDPLSGSYSDVDAATGRAQTVAARLHLSIDTGVPLAPTLEPVSGDDLIIDSEAAAGVLLTGVAEPLAQVSLQWSRGFAPMTVDANESGRWQLALSSQDLALLGNGDVELTLTATDLAGNVGASASHHFTLDTSALAAPDQLTLHPEDDTGRSSTDALTQRSQVRVQGRAGASQAVTVFIDTDGDGQLGSSEWSAQTTSDAQGQFVQLVGLQEGSNAVRAFALDTSSGRQSVAGQALDVVMDTEISAVSGLVVSLDDRINLAERSAQTSISGLGEPSADVQLEWRNGAGDLVLTQSTRVDIAGQWLLSLSATQVDSLGQGSLTLVVTQTDAAGNVSEPLSRDVWVDTLPPSTPDAARMAQAESLNAQGELADGVQWLDLQDGQVTVAVPLPLDLGEGGRVKLLWGSKVISHDVTAQDLADGVAQVAVDAVTVSAQGDGLPVRVVATFFDAAGNEGPWDGSQVQAVTVLNALQVDFSDRPPQITLDASSYGRAVDGVYYTHLSSAQPSLDLQYVSVRVSGFPGETVVIYSDNSGDGAYQVGETLARVTLDAAGAGLAQLSLSPTLPGQPHVLRSFSTTHMTGIETQLQVVVDLQAPEAPQLTLTDTLINQQERDDPAGTLVTGTAQPLADVSLSLINTRTGVAAQAMTVRADTTGQWQATLGLTQWAAVGDGSLRLSAQQIDWAGNISPAAHQSLVLDSFANAPTIQVVSGNDRVGAAEASGLTIQGGAEAGASVRVSLAGTASLLALPDVEANSNGLWVLQLSADQLQALGEGAVTVNAQQTDVAGNVSAAGIRSFVMDTQVSAPTMESVADDDFVNAQQAGQSVRVSGSGEAGARLVVTAELNGSSLSWHTTVSDLGQWQLSIPESDVQSLGTGKWTLQAIQTDLAGNTSQPTSRVLAVDLTEVPGAVRVDTISEDGLVSWAEQASDLPLSGIAPLGTEVYLKLQGSLGTLSTGALWVDDQGQWRSELSSEQMRDTLGPGAVRVDAWAVEPRSGQSTAANGIAEYSFTLQTQEPMPTVNAATDDGLVNAQEASAGVDVKGTGVAGHYVDIHLRGNDGELSRTVQVGQDGNWLWKLSSTNIYALGEGAVAMTLTQQDSASVSALRSLSLVANFDIDTLPPQAPLASSLQQANLYNSTHALQGGLSYVEAAAGLQLAVPLSADAQVGDKLQVSWGSKSLQHTVTQADLEAMASRRYILLKVDTDLIAQQGSGAVDVRVQISDAAGNVGDAFTLVSAVPVQAPPLAPQFDTIMDDGYVNQSEYDAAVGGSTPIRLTGLSVDGTVHVTLSREVNGQLLSWQGSAMASAGVWQLDVPAQQLALLGEGRIDISAYVQDAMLVNSAYASSSLVFDKTPPQPVSAESEALALAQVVKSELAGGLIAIDDNGGLTEAYGGTRVPVALAADAQSGDQLLLYWGSGVGRGGTSISYTLTQTDINNQLAQIQVSQDVITQFGDSAQLRVEAQAVDRAGNAGSRYVVWTGTVDAVPLAPGLGTVAGDGWVNLQESQQQVLLGGSADVGNRVQVLLRGSIGQLERSVIADALDGQGRWVLLLSSADIAALGEGEVTVSLTQTDVPTIAGMPGNASEPTLGSFIIDTVAPQAPQLDDVTSDDRISYLEATQGVRVTGTGEAGAAVLLSMTDGSQTVNKEAVLVDDSGHWQLDVTAADLSGLSAGELRFSAVQADPAGNLSEATQRIVRYSDQIIAQPSIDAVSGIGAGDAVLNLADFDAAGQQVVVSGSGVPGHMVRLGVTVAGASFWREPVAVDDGGQWQVSLTETDWTMYGQGLVQLSAVQIDAQTADESLTTRYPDFLLDTIAPSLDLATLTASGVNGNAKAGDVITALVSVSEDLRLDLAASLPQLALQVGTSVVSAQYDVAASAVAGANRLAFTYTIQVGDEDLSGGVTLAEGNAVNWQGAMVQDLAGNVLHGGIALARANTIRVDTQAPSAAQLPQVLSVGANPAATDANSPGGTFINKFEAGSVLVSVQVGLQGSQALAGDAVRLSWGAQTIDVVLSAQDIAAQSVQVAIDTQTIGATEADVPVSAQIIDAAGNASVSSEVLNLRVDTVAPDALTFGLVLGDDRISQTEAADLLALGADQGSESDVVLANVGTGTEAQAWLQQGSTRMSLNTVTDPLGRTVILAGDLGQALAQLQDGLLVLGVSQADAAGNESAPSLRNLYMDRHVPQAPVITSLAQAQDGWINLADADAGVAMTVSLIGTGAQVGDQLVISGLGSPHAQTLVASDIAAGEVALTLPGSLTLQALDAPAGFTDITARIQDHGGNASGESVAISTGWDTVILAPQVEASGVALGVGPAQSKNVGVFSGAGVEADASVVVVMTGAFGDVVRFPTVGLANGRFEVSLSPSDFQVLGEGTVSYSVQQVDLAGNVSALTTGSFPLSLSLAPPTLADVTGDNLVSADEVLQTQILQGIANGAAEVDLSFYADDILVLAKTIAPLGGDIDLVWSQALTSDDWAVLAAAGQEIRLEAFQVIDRGTSDENRSTSTLLPFAIDTVRPTLAAEMTVMRADANGDGSNNDALLVRFSEPVLVASLQSIANWQLEGGQTWGNGARVEAVSAIEANGATYAQTFRIVMGAGASVVGGETVSVAPDLVEDMRTNRAETTLSAVIPDLSALAAPTPSLTLAGDNLINAQEAATPLSTNFTFASTPNTLLKIFINGEQWGDAIDVSNTTSRTVALDAWGDDGVQSVVAQLVRTDTGQTSTYSTPKQVLKDTVVEGVSELSLLSDADRSGSLSAGDQLLLSFGERVSVQTSNLSPEFGAGAKLEAVGSVNGLASEWRLTLGSGADLGAPSLPLGAVVTDQAGNTTASVAIDLPSDLMSRPSVAYVDNVSGDNVITAADALTTVKVYLNQAASGDRVQLWVDGQPIGRAVRVGGADVDQGFVNLEVPAGDWGGDGERAVTASISRGDATYLSGDIRHVAVAIKGAHWSAQSGVEVLWFDPSTLTHLAEGDYVRSWTSSVGAMTVKTNRALSTAFRLVTDSTGNRVLVSDGSDILRSTQTWNPSASQGFTDFSLVKFLRPTTTWSYSFTHDFQGAFNYRTHFGIRGDGTSLTNHVAGFGTGYPYLLNAVTLNTWTSMLGAVDAQRVYLGSGADLLISDALQTIRYSEYERQGLIIGGTKANWNSQQETIRSLLGDQISIQGDVGTAYRQEIAVYEAVKYQTVGSQQAVLAGQLDYDLSVSAGQGVLVDEVLKLNEAIEGEQSNRVVVAGSDVVLFGAGDDVAMLTDAGFRYLDGGSGWDQLVWAADYSGGSHVYLSDWVTNFRGMSGDSVADTRVNAAGYHRLAGWEFLDMRQAGAPDNEQNRQVLHVSAADVLTLSDTQTLELALGADDVLMADAWDSVSHGSFVVLNSGSDLSTYNTRYSAVLDGQRVEMYVHGGMAEPELTSVSRLGAVVQLNVNAAMFGEAPTVGDFAVSAWGDGDLSNLNGVQTTNARQSLSLAFDVASEVAFKVSFSSAVGFYDEFGRSIANGHWGIGTNGNDVLDASTTDAPGAWTNDAAVVLLGGAGDDHLIGTAHEDVLIGGAGADTLTGGAGSDRFTYNTIYADRGGSGGLGGLSGDRITDFNTETNSANADVMDLTDLFALGAGEAFTGQAAQDAHTLTQGGFIDLVKTNYNQDLQVWVDRDGGGAMGLLVTLEGVGDYASSISGESTEQLLQCLLSEGRVQVSNA